MNIWILNHYAVPQKYYYLSRSYNFAQQLMKKGHRVTVFAASSVHNSDVNLITGDEQYREMEEDGIHYVLFRARQYAGSGKDRVINHIDCARKMERLCPGFTGKYGKPDLIFASAGQSLTLVAGIRLAKKLGVPCVCEVTDLWPESFAAYGLISRKNPLLGLLYAGERWIYKSADALIFSMEGGRDYIIDRGWDKAHGGPVDLDKVCHINNGVDLAAFDHNKTHCVLPDADLDDPDTFKVVYTGSIRKVNDLSALIGAAEILEARGENRIKLIVYGDGDEREALSRCAEDKGLKNICFKGKVDKRFIPSIVSRANLTLLHWRPTPIEKYGMSMNKLFDYLAGGRPVLANSVPAYDLIKKYDCGLSDNITESVQYADDILRIAHMDGEEYKKLCLNARRAAGEYDFKVLCDKLLDVFSRCLS